MIAALKRLGAWLVRPIRWQPVYRYERNPYRRWCGTCGQCQVKVCYADAWRRDWWEAQGAIEDPDCFCHDALPVSERPSAWVNRESEKSTSTPEPARLQ